MEKREKAVRGLECCSRMGRETGRGGCERCPYHDGRLVLNDCRAQLDRDLYEILVEEAIRSEDDGK